MLRSAAETVALLAPLAALLACAYLQIEQSGLLTLLVGCAALAVFFCGFEAGKPALRQIMPTATLGALAAAGRILFAPIPDFKPVSAICIIAGAVFGKHSGFMVGALAALCSNFFFGQGPWTPWQMFAFGLIGFLAGALAQIRLLRKETLPLCVFGGVSALVIYGGLLNPAAVLMFQDHPTKEMFLLAYLQGLPFDLIHAASTVFFLWLLAMPLLEKLERLKIKYALFADDGPSNGKRTASTKS